MTEKGHWCGVVKWSPKKQQRPFPYCIYCICRLNSEINDLLFTENSEVDLEEWEPETEPLAPVNVSSPILPWSVELTQ